MWFVLILVVVFPCQADLQQDLVSEKGVMERILALENKAQRQDNLIAQQTENNNRLQQELEEIKNSCKNERSFAKKGVQKRFLQDEGPVAFTAAVRPYTLDHVQSKATIVFETVITSIGGGYSNLTGVFVAPVTGIYVFSCSLLDHYGTHLTPDQEHGSAKLHAEVVHNGKVLGRVFAHAETTYRDQGAITVVSQVIEGDQIWIRNIDNNDLGLGGELFSLFTGFLLLQL